MPQPDTRPDSAPMAPPALRFATHAKAPDSGFRVRIQVEVGGRLGSGEGEGCGTETVELRVAAEATLGALREATQGVVDLNLVGIKRIQAFDAHTILVALSSRSDFRPRLVGAALLDGNIAQGAALAILNALESRSGPGRRPVQPRLVVPRSKPTPFEIDRGAESTPTWPGADQEPRRSPTSSSAFRTRDS